ncbi:hypothetical protein B7R75_07210 [Yersinia pseudotuberculosis]|nr:hypothetical protein B7R75_07210 [Yersinia pseudotuberculosis]
MEVINKVPVARRIRRIKGGKLQVGLSVCRSVGLSVCRSGKIESLYSGEINILRHSRRFFICAYKALLPAAP